jgi:hypothetical protein
MLAVMRRFLLALVLSGCNQLDNPFVDGDGGMTGAGGGASGAGGGATGGGSGTGGGTGSGGGSAAGGGSGTGGGGACSEDWQCSNWRWASGGMATRTCVDSNGCGTTTQKPSEGPAAVPTLDRNYYRCNVQPIVDKGCAMMGCHGNDTGVRDYYVYSRGRLRNDQIVPDVQTCLTPGQPKNLQQEGSGTVMCLGWSRLTNEEWTENIDSARLFAVGLTDMAQSQLLTQATEGTPFAHAGIKMFAAGDSEYQTVKRWLEGATAPSSCDGGYN